MNESAGATRHSVHTEKHTHAQTHTQGSNVLVTVGNFTCPNAISISVGQKT